MRKSLRQAELRRQSRKPHRHRRDPHYTFLQGDIADPQAVEEVFQLRPDAIVNFAAETHVDRNIEDASPFLRTTNPPPSGGTIVGTPAGTYNLVVTATSGGATQTQNLTLIVQ